MKKVDKWIIDTSKGKSFADIGGLWGTVNEKATHAIKAGAANSYMIDITPLGTELWAKFDEQCIKENVNNVKCMQADINDPNIIAKIGTYDIIHTSGVLYHCPDPIHTILQYSRVSKEFLILGSTVLDGIIKNKFGQLEIERGGSLLVPALNEKQKIIISEYFYEVGAKELCGISNNLDLWEISNYEPWWWLFTTEFIEAILKVNGFNIIDTTKEWNNRVSYFLCKKSHT